MVKRNSMAYRRKQPLDISGDPYRLWQHRMERECKWQGIYDEIKEIQKNSDKVGYKGFVNIMRSIAKERDYRGSAEERVLFAEFLQEEEALLDGDAKAKAKFEFIVSEKMARSTPRKENNWIASHPAMRRRDRDPEDNKVILTVEDILDAPSQAAVNKLQSWSNAPRKFFEMVQAAEKPPPKPVIHKKEEKKESTKKVADPTLAEAEEILSNFVDDLLDLDE